MKRSKHNAFLIFGGGTPRLPKGGQRYSLIGGDSYGC